MERDLELEQLNNGTYRVTDSDKLFLQCLADRLHKINKQEYCIISDPFKPEKFAVILSREDMQHIFFDYVCGF